MEEIALKELLKQIRRIEIQTERLSSGQLMGAYRSVFKGRGMEFEEVREYTPTDDYRSIDWNVTARMQAPYVKLFSEERQLDIMLFVDLSKSCLSGSHYGSK